MKNNKNKESKITKNTIVDDVVTKDVETGETTTENKSTDKKAKENKKYEIKIWKCILSVVFAILSVMLVYLLVWSKYIFGNVPFAQVLFHVMVPLEGTDSSIIASYFYGVAPWVALMVAAIIGTGVIYHFVKEKKFKNKILKLVFGINKFLVRKMVPFTSFLLAIVLIVNFFGFGIHFWLIDRFDSSTLYEDYYVDAAKANIKAPEKKKNLIVVLSESLEASFTDDDNGGCMDRNYMPKLTALAKENTHFSRNETLAGAVEVEGTGWTIAAMVAQMSGVPLVLPIGRNSYGKYGEFLPGITSMGEILKKYGYNNEIIIGSKREFAGVDTFFEQHGEYEIFDYYTALEEEYVTGHNGFWGIDDKDLLQIAKDEISQLAAKDEPFSVIVNTIDLHTPGGYICEDCYYEYNHGYKNIIACQDRQLTRFVEWCKTQEFYEDTVIVVAGDHLSMAPVVKNEFTPEGYDRSVYNAIINSDLEPVNATNRLFTTMDMFPTILASLGFEIEGDRLGLGTNLYSDKKTVMEEVGKKEFMEEISKNSKLYNKEILGTR